MVQGIVGFVEGVGDAFLVVEGLDDVMPAVDLLHLAVDVAQVFLLRLEVFLGFLHNEPDEAQGNRQDDEGDESHQPADGQHHDQHADDGGDGGDDLGQALVQALGQGV